MIGLLLRVWPFIIVAAFYSAIGAGCLLYAPKIVAAHARLQRENFPRAWAHSRRLTRYVRRAPEHPEEFQSTIWFIRGLGAIFLALGVAVVVLFVAA